MEWWHKILQDKEEMKSLEVGSSISTAGIALVGGLSWVFIQPKNGLKTGKPING
jgi:hypothetical protein